MASKKALVEQVGPISSEERQLLLQFQSLHAAGKLKEAVEVLKEGQKKDFGIASLNLAEFLYSGIPPKHVPDYPGAAAAYLTALGKLKMNTPLYTNAFKNLGELLRSQKVTRSMISFKPAHRLIKKVARVEPGDDGAPPPELISEARLALGLLAYDEDRRKKAAFWYRKVLEVEAYAEALPPVHPDVASNSKGARFNLDQLSGTVSTVEVGENITVKRVPLSSKIQRQDCVLCHSELHLMKCGRCRKVYYCSRDCQTRDWKNHKAICKEPSANEGREPGKQTTSI
eukprot:TRINITY_DN6255_c0_g1_i1.p1 TRINITY_DN6255_c0_g1~~TRINITY_DN6255_c0_g1_i1.p1  ORF type:complete len:285 (-),score=54.45 TRINITY_DN6255_c0_g1_i1:711-1565(-)